MIKQTGLIEEVPKPSDWLMSGETGVDTTARLPEGDWTAYLPTEERQSRRDEYYFDTLSCVTFSALNSIEIQLNLMLKENRIPADVLKQMTQLGFLINGQFNFSDRFTGILSNTTKAGNTLTAVWDSIRKDGLLPEADFPFGGTSWESYHNRSLITPAMRAKAKIILGLFDFKYDWSFNTFDSNTTTKAREALKTSPLHTGITLGTGGHAICHVVWNADGTKSYMDSYPPYLKSQVPKDNVRFALRGVVTLKDRIFPIHVFNNDLYVGLETEEVIILQQILRTLGFLKVNPTGKFMGQTRQAVIDFQNAYDLYPLQGYVGAKTRAVLNQICSTDVPEIHQRALIDVIIDGVRGWFNK